MKGVFKVNKVEVSMNVSVIAPKTATLSPNCDYKEYFIAIRDNEKETIEDRKAAAGVYNLIKLVEESGGKIADLHLKEHGVLNFSFSFSDQPMSTPELTVWAKDCVLSGQEAFRHRMEIKELEEDINELKNS